VTSEFVLRLRAASPNDADAVFRAAALAVKNGYEDEALPLLDQAAALHPGDARIWQIIGLAHRNREDLAPAVAAFEKSAALAPNDPLIAHSLARTSLEAGLPAIDLFDRALRLAPDDDWAQLGRFAAQYAEDRVDQSIADLEEKLRAQPLWLPGHATLARLRWLKGEREDFAASYEAAAAAAPRDVAVWREWADTLMHANRYEEVLALIARGRAAAGAHPVFDAFEAIAVAEQGQSEEADRLFAVLGPIGHVTMAARYMRHLLRAGRPREAAAFAEPWLSGEQADLIWPYLASAWRLIGDSRWEMLEGDERLVGVYDLAGEIPSLPALAGRLRSLHLALGQPLEQSVRGGTQTDGPLFSRIEPEIRALRAAIAAAVERHIAQLPPARKGHPTLLDRRGKVRFAGSWSVRLPGAGFHSNHVHPAGWISSAFYVALPEAMGGGEQGWLTLGAPQAELGLDLAPFRTIEPKPGRLVLFPSTMWHGTIPFAEGERLTVAFDVARPL
jgi:tetratricopeptide (TPR) repeat protein